MKALLVFGLACLLASCATVKSLEQYQATKERRKLVKDKDGCFQVWLHPSDPNKALVRECESSELGQALTEGVIEGLTLGVLDPDHGALGSEFARAAEKATGKRVLGVSKLNDGWGATGAYEVFLLPR